MKIEIRKKWLSDKKSEYNDHLEDNRGKKNQEVSFRGRMIYKAMMQAEEMLSESIYDYNSLLSHYKNLDDILDEEQGISTRTEGSKIELICENCSEEFSTYSTYLDKDFEKFSKCRQCREEKDCPICGRKHYNRGECCSTECSTELRKQNTTPDFRDMM